MNEKEKEARISRLNNVFNTCIDGKKESSIAIFGVDSFPALIGKKFYFLIDDFHLLSYWFNPNSKGDPPEAFLGQVTGVDFRFVADNIEVPDGKSWEQCLHEAETICDLSGYTCYPFIQTTIGTLRLIPPGVPNNTWYLKLNNGPTFEGKVIFL